MKTSDKIRTVADVLRNNLLGRNGALNMTILDGAINQLHIIANRLEDGTDGTIHIEAKVENQNLLVKCAWCDVYGCDTDHFHEDFSK